MNTYVCIYVYIYIHMCVYLAGDILVHCFDMLHGVEVQEGQRLSLVVWFSVSQDACQSRGIEFVTHMNLFYDSYIWVQSRLECIGVVVASQDAWQSAGKTFVIHMYTLCHS